MIWRDVVTRTLYMLCLAAMTPQPRVPVIDHNGRATWSRK